MLNLYFTRYRNRRWSPIWGAFTATTVSAVYLIAGFSGYHLNRRARFFSDAAWADSIIWWQVGAGAAVIPVAIYFWRKGAREIDQRLATEQNSHRLNTD
ncbi:MAG: hypothetical protein Q8T13_17910 [Acidobacteriota bacterium]|nr:hypothetical protein [Acidobacteriota bacterium]